MAMMGERGVTQVVVAAMEAVATIPPRVLGVGAEAMLAVTMEAEVKVSATMEAASGAAIMMVTGATLVDSWVGMTVVQVAEAVEAREVDHRSGYRSAHPSSTPQRDTHAGSV